MTVKELENKLDQREFLQWRAFFQFEPFGTAIEDYRVGKVLAVMKGGHPLQYVPGHDREEAEEVLAAITQRQNMEDIKTRMMAGFQPPEE